MTGRQRRIVRQVLPWVVTLGMLGLWELVCHVFHVAEFILPPPSAVAAAMSQYHAIILDNAAWTLLTTALGFGLALVCGLIVILGSLTNLVDLTSGWRAGHAPFSPILAHWQLHATPPRCSSRFNARANDTKRNTAST